MVKWWTKPSRKTEVSWCQLGALENPQDLVGFETWLYIPNFHEAGLIVVIRVGYYLDL